MNGVSLLGQSNASAMETLRRALLRTDGPVPGAITITIARKLAHRSESVSSLLTDSSGKVFKFFERIFEKSLKFLWHNLKLNKKFIYTISANTETFGCKIDDSPGNGENSGASENSDNTVIFKPPYNKNHIGMHFFSFSFLLCNYRIKNNQFIYLQKTITSEIQ